MQHIVMSGKRLVHHHGCMIWKGGYEVILNVICKLLSQFVNVDFQTMCPECLAQSDTCSAST